MPHISRPSPATDHRMINRTGRGGQDTNARSRPRHGPTLGGDRTELVNAPPTPGQTAGRQLCLEFSCHVRSVGGRGTPPGRHTSTTRVRPTTQTTCAPGDAIEAGYPETPAEQKECSRANVMSN